MPLKISSIPDKKSNTITNEILKFEQDFELKHKMVSFGADNTILNFRGKDRVGQNIDMFIPLKHYSIELCPPILRALFALKGSNFWFLLLSSLLNFTFEIYAEIRIFFKFKSRIMSSISIVRCFNIWTIGTYAYLNEVERFMWLSLVSKN